MATFFIPLTTLTLAGLDHGRLPAAAGLTNFVRLLCGAFGTSITTTIWENRATLHHAQLTQIAKPGEPAFDSLTGFLHGHGMTHHQSAALVNGLINEKAFTMSAADFFYISAVLFVIMIPLIWTSRPPKMGADGGAAAAAH
jgi:DHA2 family multidrug resistance protein